MDAAAAFDRQSRGEPANRLSAVFAGGLGEGRGAAQESSYSRRREVPDQARDRARQIKAALTAGVAPGVVLTDAAYGSDGAFRSGVTAMGLTYAGACSRRSAAGPPTWSPCHPNPGADMDASPRARGATPIMGRSRQEAGEGASRGAWRIVSWREGSNETLSSRFAAVRVRPASRDWQVQRPIRSNGSHRMARRRKRADEILAFDLARRCVHRVLVDTAKLRWASTRLRGTEERTRPRPFRGTRLARLPSSRNALHRRLWSPHPRTSGDSPLRPRGREKPRLSGRPRPRGAADPTRAPRRKLDHDNPTAADRRAGPNPNAPPALPSHTTKTSLSEIVVTQ